MSLALARRYKQDVSTDGTTWVKLGGRSDFAPTETPTVVGADDYDSGGFNGFEKTMTGWQAVSKFQMPTTAGIPSDPGQMLLEATRFQFGDACRAYTRWYDRNGGTDAWSGRALIDWNQSKTGVPDIAEVTVTFKGDGPLARIANPYASTVAPIVTAATPSGAAAGSQVSIYGGGFLGATSVKFGAVSVVNPLIVSDSLIVAIMPAGSAGSAAVTVTTAAGTSNALPYTRGA